MAVSTLAHQPSPTGGGARRRRAWGKGNEEGRWKCINSSSAYIPAVGLRSKKTTTLQDTKIVHPDAYTVRDLWKDNES